MAEPVVKKKALGSVVITAERCKGCGFCVEFCPTDALKLSDQYNAKGYHVPVLHLPEACNGCNICGLLCPDFAIYGFMYQKKQRTGA
jgi:2-oxoglutarate ferredoxin oxidoreductase subunit delta